MAERGARHAYHPGGGDGGEGDLPVACVVLGQQVCGGSSIHPSEPKEARIKRVIDGSSEGEQRIEGTKNTNWAARGTEEARVPLASLPMSEKRPGLLMAAGGGRERRG